MSTSHYTSQQIERFWNKVALAEPHECWNWTASRNHKGYGVGTVKQKHFGAHRFSWTIAFGAIPDGLHVCHKCDNPSCVNPQHLFLGTNADNVRDRDQKGRAFSPVGEFQGAHKLTWEKVALIRQRYAAGGISQPQLAREYGVTQANIWDILHFKSWKEPKP